MRGAALTVRVRVLVFAALRERLGRGAMDVEVEVGTTAGALYARLFPAGPAGALPVAFTVDRVVVPGDTVLTEGAEVAFLPPLGGG